MRMGLDSIQGALDMINTSMDDKSPWLGKRGLVLQIAIFEGAGLSK